MSRRPKNVTTKQVLQRLDSFGFNSNLRSLDKLLTNTHVITNKSLQAQIVQYRVLKRHFSVYRWCKRYKSYGFTY